MATKFNMSRDINGFNGFGLMFTDTAYQVTLPASTEKHFTVPSNTGMGGFGISTTSQWIALFSFGSGTTSAGVWVANNHTATIPSSSFAATFSELNPSARMVQGGDVLSFITSDTGVQVSVMLYSFS